MAIMYYIFELYQKVSLVKTLVGLIDMLFLAYSFVQIAKIAGFVISVQNIAAFAEIRNLKLKNISFLKVLTGTTDTTLNGNQRKRLQMAYKFNTYYREWNAAYGRSMLTNQALVSPILGVTLVTNLACSVYFVCILQYRDVGPWEMTALLGTLGMQVLFTLEPIICTIKLCKALYWIEKYAILMQLQMEQHFHLKLKLNNFYELINNNNRFTFTVGCFGKISTKSLFELLTGGSLSKKFLILKTLIFFSLFYCTLGT